LVKAPALEQLFPGYELWHLFIIGSSASVCTRAISMFHQEHADIEIRQNSRGRGSLHLGIGMRDNRSSCCDAMIVRMLPDSA
jgi:hypothetical protein